MVNLLLILVLVAAFAMLYGQGIWSNCLTLVNLLLAGVLATSFFEPLANVLERQEPTFTYLWDFVALWSLFAIFFLIVRVPADYLSRTRVRFKNVVDLAGGAFLALWISWVLVCFTAMTLHTAPLARAAFLGSFQPEPDSRLLFGLAPDLQWLGFMQKISSGAMSTSPPEGVAGEDGSNVFDPRAEFVYKYSERRARLERTPALRVPRSDAD